MTNKSLHQNFTEIISIARSYVNARIELWKLSLLEKTSLAGAFFLSSVIIVLIVAFCLLFISLAFSFWYGQKTGDITSGFLITAGFYVLLGIIFVVSRKYLLTGPVIRTLSSILFKDDLIEEQEDDEK
ncbi:MAG: LPXTG cell wall anchor domain-containing protein [Bacteroidales bacterium]